MTDFIHLPAARLRSGTVALPGSKSISNRTLLLAALADNDCEIVAFASANLGYAAASTGMDIGSFLLNLLFVLMIGVVNLWVSFALALVVALRAREARLGNIGTLLAAVAAEVKARPLSLVFPPKNEVEATVAEEEIAK